MAEAFDPLAAAAGPWLTPEANLRRLTKLKQTAGTKGGAAAELDRLISDAQAAVAATGTGSAATPALTGESRREALKKSVKSNYANATKASLDVVFDALLELEAERGFSLRPRVDPSDVFLDTSDGTYWTDDGAEEDERREAGAAAGKRTEVQSIHDRASEVEQEPVTIAETIAEAEAAVDAAYEAMADGAGDVFLRNQPGHAAKERLRKATERKAHLDRLLPGLARRKELLERGELVQTLDERIAEFAPITADIENVYREAGELLEQIVGRLWPALCDAWRRYDAMRRDNSDLLAEVRGRDAAAAARWDAAARPTVRAGAAARRRVLARRSRRVAGSGEPRCATGRCSFAAVSRNRLPDLDGFNNWLEIGQNDVEKVNTPATASIVQPDPCEG